MGIYCHECHYGVQNPFYVMRLAVRGDKGKIAFSELEYAVCRVDIDRINATYTSNALSYHPIAYAIDKVTGKKGGPSDSQVVDIDRREEQHKFILRSTALDYISKTAKDLLKNPRFVEPGADKKPADWAQKVFEFLLVEQSKNPESAF
jgi:hypothetical protein